MYGGLGYIRSRQTTHYGVNETVGSDERWILVGCPVAQFVIVSICIVLWTVRLHEISYWQYMYHMPILKSVLLLPESCQKGVNKPSKFHIAVKWIMCMRVTLLSGSGDWTGRRSAPAGYQVYCYQGTGLGYNSCSVDVDRGLRINSVVWYAIEDKCTCLVSE